MSYRSMTRSLPKTLRKTLRQPIYIAGMASVGIHGLLFAFLPFLPLDASQASEPDIQRQVSLIELSPEEQSRLPNFSNFSTPTIPLPSTAPSRSKLYSLSPLPTTPSQPPTLSYPNLPFFNPLPPPPPALPSFPSQWVPFANSGIPVRPASPSPTRNAPSTPSPIPSPDVSTPATPSPSARDLAPNGSSTPGTPPAGPVAANPPSPAPAGSRALADQQQLISLARQLNEYDPKATGEGYATEQYNDWLRNQLGRSLADISKVPGVILPANFPREFCLSQLLLQNPEVWFGVRVNSQNTVVGEPHPLKSSGNALIDQQAKETVMAFSFTPRIGIRPGPKRDNTDYELDNGDRAYFVRVQFDRSRGNCPQVTVPQAPPPS